MALLNTSYWQLCGYRPQDGYGLRHYLKQSADKKTVTLSWGYKHEEALTHMFDGIITIKAGNTTLWTYTSNGVGDGTRNYMVLPPSGGSEVAVSSWGGTRPSLTFTLPENCTSIRLIVQRARTNYSASMSYRTSSDYHWMYDVDETFAVEPYFNDAVQLYDGSAWNKYKAQIYNGSWADYKPQVYDGSAWKDVG